LTHFPDFIPDVGAPSTSPPARNNIAIPQNASSAFNPWSVSHYMPMRVHKRKDTLT